MHNCSPALSQSTFRQHPNSPSNLHTLNPPLRPTPKNPPPGNTDQALLKLGADPNKTNQGGATALHFAAAAKRNAAAAVEVLLDGGADPLVVDDMG